jgi:hypothetical protein
MSRQILLFIIFGTTAFTAFSQSHKFSYTGYKLLPSVCRHQDSLIQFIIPDRPYSYWEYVDADPSPGYGSINFSQGVKPAGVTFTKPADGFFTGCLPAWCSHFIAYVYQDKVGYVTSEKQLTQFLGHIDNLQEAVLLAELSGVGFVDTNLRPKGASYKPTKDGYDLILMNYQLCPQTWKAVRVIINQDKVLKKTNLGIYHTEPGCAVI